MNKELSNSIVNNLKLVITNPHCELDYTNVFELIVAVALSAQTTDKRVNEVTPSLFAKYKTPYELSMAKLEDVEEIVKTLGMYKTKAKNIIALAGKIHSEYDDTVPNTMDELVKLPGVGRKTASVVLVEGYKIPAFPVDTHLLRMANVFGYSKSEDPLVVEKVFTKYIAKEDWGLVHHLFLLFGRYYCKAKNPLCDSCKLKEYCKKKKKN